MCVLTGMELDAVLVLHRLQLICEVKIVVEDMIGDGGVIECVEGGMQVIQVDEPKGECSMRGVCEVFWRLYVVISVPDIGVC